MAWPKGRPKPESVKRKIREAWDDSMRADARARVQGRTDLFPGRWDGDARERMSKMKARPCEVDGIRYDSVTLAGRGCDVAPHTIRAWIWKGKRGAKYLEQES